MTRPLCWFPVGERETKSENRGKTLGVTLGYATSTVWPASHAPNLQENQDFPDRRPG